MRSKIKFDRDREYGVDAARRHANRILSSLGRPEITRHWIYNSVTPSSRVIVGHRSPTCCPEAFFGNAVQREALCTIRSPRYTVRDVLRAALGVPEISGARIAARAVEHRPSHSELRREVLIHMQKIESEMGRFIHFGSSSLTPVLGTDLPAGAFRGENESIWDAIIMQRGMVRVGHRVVWNDKNKAARLTEADRKNYNEKLLSLQKRLRIDFPDIGGCYLDVPWIFCWQHAYTGPCEFTRRQQTRTGTREQLNVPGGLLQGWSLENNPYAVFTITEEVFYDRGERVASRIIECQNRKSLQVTKLPEAV